MHQACLLPASCCSEVTGWGRQRIIYTNTVCVRALACCQAYATTKLPLSAPLYTTTHGGCATLGPCALYSPLPFAAPPHTLVHAMSTNECTLTHLHHRLRVVVELKELVLLCIPQVRVDAVADARELKVVGGDGAGATWEWNKSAVHRS